MAFGSNKIKAGSVHQKMKGEIDKKINQQQNSLDIRNSRTGWRGFGAYQLVRYYGGEGVYIVDIGGPAIVGR